MLTLAVVAIAGICIFASCTKDNQKVFNNSENVNLSDPSSTQSKNIDLHLIAEITTDTIYEKMELLDLGNIHESKWNKRVFEYGKFQHDVNYISDVFDTKFALISCEKDRVTIETEEGDTITFFNIASEGKKVKFDMLGDNKEIVHFTFTTEQEIDFVNDLQMVFDTYNSKMPFLAVVAVVGAAAAVGSLAVGIISLAKDQRNRECDIRKRNGERDCTDWGCGIREGNCCVWCTGGNAHPNCKHSGAVRGEGTDCNNH